MPKNGIKWWDNAWQGESILVGKSLNLDKLVHEELLAQSLTVLSMLSVGVLPFPCQLSDLLSEGQISNPNRAIA